MTYKGWRLAKTESILSQPSSVTQVEGYANTRLFIKDGICLFICVNDIFFLKNIDEMEKFIEAAILPNSFLCKKLTTDELENIRFHD